jgi:hypothetical protein
LSRGHKKKSGDWDPVNRGVEEPQECCCLQKFIDGNCHVTCSIHVRAMPPFSWVFPGLPDKNFDWQIVLVAQIPCGQALHCQKTNEHWSDSGFAHFHFSWDGESLQRATTDFGVLSRGCTPQSLIHHLW